MALKEVAVVASSEPSELVAFVSCRAGAGEVTPEALKAHCQAAGQEPYCVWAARGEAEAAREG